MMRSALPPALGLALLATTGSAQSFEEKHLLVVGGAPFNNSTTDNMDFGDVDRDGDWDLVLADGGGNGIDQNRIWINLGGLQTGTVGTFQDETATRLPVFNDASRDVELADIDSDDDLDVFIANTSLFLAPASSKGSRWWVNKGGQQAGTLGYFADETAGRWIGLGGEGSSIPPSHVLPSPEEPVTFLDWSCDADFGDIDNDGDLDLVHSSYGPSFSGHVPTRIFLNDGDGFFSEFNPSGFQLLGQNIQDGDPGLWCEGVQTDGTFLADGTQCDVAASPEDIDLGDVDGDLDLDLLLGSVATVPRLFLNRLEENGGVLAFRDVTGAALSFHHSGTTGAYDQEMGDLDGDDDLDIYGIGWSASAGFVYEDLVLENDGAGSFQESLTLEGSESDDQCGDLIDYDNDGDVDLLAGDWSGPTRLYRNDGAAFPNASDELPSVVSHVTMDLEVADWDNDGDYDFVEAANDGARNRFFSNETQIPDTTPPRLTKLEAVAGHASSPEPDVVRVQVYDNVPAPLLYFQEVGLGLRVDGIVLPRVPMRSSGGQIFRGELPGNLVGHVQYLARGDDPYGNVGFSNLQEHTNTGSTGTSQGTASPGPLGEPTLRSLTQPFTGAPLHLATSNATPGTSGFYLASLQGTLPALVLGDGLVLNVAPPFVVPPIAVQASLDGNLVLSLLDVPPVLSGLALHVQCWVLGGAGGASWSSTKSLSLAFP